VSPRNIRADLQRAPPALTAARRDQNEKVPAIGVCGFAVHRTRGIGGGVRGGVLSSGLLGSERIELGSGGSGGAGSTSTVVSGDGASVASSATVGAHGAGAPQCGAGGGASVLEDASAPAPIDSEAEGAVRPRPSRCSQPMRHPR